MSSNFRQFSAEVERFAEREVPQAVRRVHRVIGLQALRGVVNKTPVKTGRARGNWQTTLGQPAVGDLERTDKEGGETISLGRTTIEQVQPFGVIWLSNNVPYIGRLEDGSSTQAPNGMVSVTLTEIKSQFRRVE